MSDRTRIGRFTAPADRDIVVFLLGARINTLTAVRSWAPVIAGFRRMMRELRTDPDSGLLGHLVLPRPPRLLTVVQYWESPEKLYAYAADPDQQHRPMWTDFYRRTKAAGDHIGIWHETYIVPAGFHESVYVNMPRFGLGKAIGSAPIDRRTDRAADRLRGTRPNRGQQISPSRPGGGGRRR
ncbi:DUF4188 domain-containing protein [Saccharopolyspora pogona]|uniref:DUF4188 domain-containing protein n=1 Tax=Saccharopolyspora pogona TaxID=333966 RepID=UPI00168946EB|nr:DUF4188 domain-containing protein [Saccharopolyspora pogona]